MTGTEILLGAALLLGGPHGVAQNGTVLSESLRCKGRQLPYAWGLHDMHGNFYEWCRDWYHRKLPGGIDPDLHAAKETATKSEHGDISRARRGGCWADEGWPCRSAFRLRFEPGRRYDHVGFRVIAIRAWQPESAPKK